MFGPGNNDIEYLVCGLQAQGINRLQLTDYNTVVKVVEMSKVNPSLGNTKVILIRGTSVGSLTYAQRNNCCNFIKDENCGRPTDEHASSQVSGSRPGKPQQKLPEFTCEVEASCKWAKRGGWMIVEIEAQYLEKGDVGQAGWVCHYAAPIKVLAVVKHPKPVIGLTVNAD